MGCGTTRIIIVHLFICLFHRNILFHFVSFHLIDEVRARRAAEETERRERKREKDDLIKRNAETQDLVNSRKQQGKQYLYYHYISFYNLIAFSLFLDFHCISMLQS